MIRTVCGFLAQSKNGEIGAWVNLIHMNRLPKLSELDSLTENIRIQENNVVILGIYEIYEVQENHGNIFWRNKDISNDDMNLIYDYVLMIEN